jgi:putative NADH-flavin reductase
MGCDTVAVARSFQFVTKATPILEEKAVADAAIATAHATNKRLMVVGGAGSLMQFNGHWVMELLPAEFQKG